MGQCWGDKIDISPKVVSDDLLTDDTLLHELCHWYCHEIGEDDRDHTKFFENELEKIGASSTYTTDLVNGKYLFIYKYGCYECEVCGNRLETKDYLEEKKEHNIGTPIKKYFCCDVKMYFSGTKNIAEEFIENEKLKAIRNAYQQSKLEVQYG